MTQRNPRIKVGYLGPKDLTGQVFGKWTVLGRVNVSNIPGKITMRWQCQCICGSLLCIQRSKLTSGKTSSCRKCVDYPEGRKSSKGKFTSTRKYSSREEACLAYMYQDYERCDKKTGRTFDLSFETFKYLSQQNCFYCSAPPYRRDYKDRPIFYANGVDRVDNSLGHTNENCVSCCPQCNRAKAKSSDVEFIEMCCRVAINHGATIWGS